MPPFPLTHIGKKFTICSMLEQPKVNHSSGPHDEEAFRVLSELHNFLHLTQRELSKSLNISLGKTNYLIQQLIKKGIVKMKSFSHNPGKIKKMQYILTPKGAKEKTKLTYHFLKRKEAEFNKLKDEWKCLQA